MKTSAGNLHLDARRVPGVRLLPGMRTHLLLALALSYVLAGCGQAPLPAPSPQPSIAATPMPAATSTSTSTMATETVASTRIAGTAFQPAPCAFSIPISLTAKVDCGWLTVPEMRGATGTPAATGATGATNGRTIRLHVARLRSRGAHPAPDPLVILGGGPGQRTIDALLEMVPKMGSVLATRDIVLFDQRGAGYSLPSLDCPEHDPARCRARLVREGIDLSAYTNNENADDVDDLRAALGCSRANLYGGSYGTLLALTVMRRHPEGVRSVVLDSVVPPQVGIEIEEARTFEQALGKLFQACAADLECDAAYPGLEQVFYRLVAQLNRSPVTVHVPGKSDGGATEGFDTQVNGSGFAYLVWYFMQYSEAVPYLPRLIHHTAQGDFGPLSDLLRIQATAPDSISEGMQCSVQCSCMTPFESPEEMSRVVAGLRPELRQAVTWPGYELCKVWDVPQAAPEDRLPVSSDIPTLLMSGWFDPLSPPSFADVAAATLSRHYSYVFPATGHGVVRTSDCAWQMMSAFLDAPTQAPESRCVQEMPGVRFVTELKRQEEKP